MNRLPEHRRIVMGRTHSSTWDAASHDPIQFYRRTEWRATLFMAALALVVFIGVALGAM